MSRSCFAFNIGQAHKCDQSTRSFSGPTKVTGYRESIPSTWPACSKVVRRRGQHHSQGDNLATSKRLIILSLCATASPWLPLTTNFCLWSAIITRLPGYQLAQKGIPWEPMKAHRAKKHRRNKFGQYICCSSCCSCCHHFVGVAC